MSSLIYDPTWILSAQSTHYFFQPSDESSGYQLFVLDRPKSVTPDTVSSAPAIPLPDFGDTTFAFVPAIDAHDHISIIAGQCDNEDGRPKLWQLGSSDKNRTWQEIDNDATANNIKINKLAASFTFPSDTNTTSEIFIFGGMCPTIPSSGNDWVSSANYSNTLLTISQDSSGMPQSFNTVPPRAPPIAEAGHSITPLTPSYIANDASESPSRNQNFVLIGGHTQHAFINMSQIALFSLPERSWAFVVANLPSTSQSTGLQRRDFTPIVDSRSGHSAVLSNDGKRVIVFGGWVGDTSQIADPQLVILEIGKGFGGTGDWRWTIPDTKGAGVAAGSGIYGHGAVMLDQDVMMISGGYQIAPHTSNSRRRQPFVRSSQTLFLNTSSGEWISSWSHQNTQDTPSAQRIIAQATRQSSGSRLGTGLGLVFGLVILLIAGLLYYWYSERKRKHRMQCVDQHRDHIAPVFKDEKSDHTSQYTPQHREETDMNKTNSPLLPRKPVATTPRRPSSPAKNISLAPSFRNPYQTTPPRHAFEPGEIHPIDEQDEGGVSEGGQLSPTKRWGARDDSDYLGQMRSSAPFRSQKPSFPHYSPSRRMGEQRSGGKWLPDWTSLNPARYQEIRQESPERATRTSSTVSDEGHSIFSETSLFGTLESTACEQSTHKHSPSAPDLSYQHNDVNMCKPVTYADVPPPVPPHRSHGRTQSSSAIPCTTPYRPPCTTNLFVTPPATDRNGYEGSYVTLLEGPEQTAASNSESIVQHNHCISPIKAQTKARGWMGSIRRAFVGDRPNTQNYREMADQKGSSLLVPSRPEPRRAVSAGDATPWRSRQGAQDWTDADTNRTDTSYSRGHGRTSGKGEDGDWDVESAAEKRMVQITFTVPRERLRVVNRNSNDGDTHSMSSTSDDGHESNHHRHDDYQSLDLGDLGDSAQQKEIF